MKPAGELSVTGSLRLQALFLWLSALLFLLPLSGFAQVKMDTSRVDSIVTPKHSPKKATIMSALLPGLGQAYNRKYWKIPIIYAGLLTTGYFIYTNHRDFKEYRKGYISLANGDTLNDPFKGRLSSEQLGNAMEEFRYDRDLSVIIAIGIYALNVIDAAVDAHLFYFDVSDNLALRASPQASWAFANHRAPQITTGISLSLYFKK
jgi:hypothetical protein